MQEILLEKAKEIIIEPQPIPQGSVYHHLNRPGRLESLMKFTRLLMQAEIYTINDIEMVKNSSHDLTHLSGIHKFRYNSKQVKAEELRMFWTDLWREDRAIHQIDGLKQYIIDVCETSAFRAGHGKRPYGLFLSYGGSMRHHNHPWRTDQWYADHAPVRIPFIPLTEFYPYISVTPSEEMLYQMLRENRVQFWKQTVVGFYIADIILPDRMLIIEVDGQHHKQKVHRKRDTTRTKWLNRFGFKVARISNKNVPLLDLNRITKFPHIASVGECKRSIRKANRVRDKVVEKGDFVPSEFIFSDPQVRAIFSAPVVDEIEQEFELALFYDRT